MWFRMLFRDVLAANVVLGLVRLLGQLPSGGALCQQDRGIIRTGLLTAWVPLRSAGVVQGCPGGHCSIGPGLSHRLLGQPTSWWRASPTRSWHHPWHHTASTLRPLHDACRDLLAAVVALGLVTAIAFSASYQLVARFAKKLHDIMFGITLLAP